MSQPYDYPLPENLPQQPATPPSPTNARGQRVRGKAVIAALAVVAIIAIGCSSGGSDTAGPGAQDAAGDTTTSSDEKAIVLEVAGAKKASVTYGLNADQSQDNGAKLPWKKSLKSSEALTIATVTAQNAGSGTITCKITVDGKVVKENKSTGEFAIVTCTTDALT